MISFTIRGKVHSNNRNWKFGGGERPYKDKDSAEYEKRVFSLAYAAAAAGRWTLVTRKRSLAVHLACWNVNLDIDNVPKLILDGMENAVYEDDNCIGSLTIVMNEDPYDQRVEVTVQHIKPVTVFFGKVRS